WLLELVGTDHGVLVLRVASVVANGTALILIASMLRRAWPRASDAAWALPFLATTPVWLVVMRTGIEVTMFMPLLIVLGLFLFLRRTPRAEFAGGFVWGVAVYSHVIAACFAVGIALAAWRTERRVPLVAPRRALLGVLLGVAPRLFALIVFHEPLAGTAAARYSLLRAVADLRWLPLCLWRTLHGDTAYLRYVGRLALTPWPYWILAIGFLLPWRRRHWPLPRPARFMLYATFASAVLVTVAAPYIAVRFFPLSVLGLSASLVLLGAGAIARDPSWRWPVAGSAALMSLCNLFYYGVDFVRPWERQELGLVKFFLGDRSKETGNWAYLPKEELVQELRALAPQPQQIVTGATLVRPLRVLLAADPVRVAMAGEADHALRSVFIDYRWPDSPEQHCDETPTGALCFRGPKTLARYFVLYPDR
ncbi:MAG TPA: hypothetical protein VMG12_13705, partial [Polyangiaceae bacterium]|nr:hypothetical protein [Polyangiaceae bacterium]